MYEIDMDIVNQICEAIKEQMATGNFRTVGELLDCADEYNISLIALTDEQVLSSIKNADPTEEDDEDDYDDEDDFDDRYDYPYDVDDDM